MSTVKKPQRAGRPTPQQRNLLQARISNLFGYSARTAAEERSRIPDTPEVKAARKITAAFDKVNRRRAERVTAKFRALEREAHEAVAFSDPIEAIAYLKALEAKHA